MKKKSMLAVLYILSALTCNLTAAGWRPTVNIEIGEFPKKLYCAVNPNNIRLIKEPLLIGEVPYYPAPNATIFTSCQESIRHLLTLEKVLFTALTEGLEKKFRKEGAGYRYQGNTIPACAVTLSYPYKVSYRQ